MAKVITGTRQAAQKVGIIKTTHAAGIGKIRCSGCKVGMAVEVMTTQGKRMRCERCGREYSISQPI